MWWGECGLLCAAAEWVVAEEVAVAQKETGIQTRSLRPYDRGTRSCMNRAALGSVGCKH